MRSAVLLVHHLFPSEASQLNNVGLLSSQWFYHTNNGRFYLMFKSMDGCKLIFSVHTVDVCVHENVNVVTHVCLYCVCVKSFLQLGFRTSGGVPLLKASCINLPERTEEREDHTNLEVKQKKNIFIFDCKNNNEYQFHTRSLFTVK